VMVLERPLNDTSCISVVLLFPFERKRSYSPA
jgi:hypothetical protein